MLCLHAIIAYEEAKLTLMCTHTWPIWWQSHVCGCDCSWSESSCRIMAVDVTCITAISNCTVRWQTYRWSKPLSPRCPSLVLASIASNICNSLPRQKSLWGPCHAELKRGDLVSCTPSYNADLSLWGLDMKQDESVHPKPGVCGANTQCWHNTNSSIYWTGMIWWWLSLMACQLINSVCMIYSSWHVKHHTLTAMQAEQGEQWMRCSQSWHCKCQHTIAEDELPTNQ